MTTWPPTDNQGNLRLGAQIIRNPGEAYRIGYEHGERDAPRTRETFEAGQRDAIKRIIRWGRQTNWRDYDSDELARALTRLIDPAVTYPGTQSVTKQNVREAQDAERMRIFYAHLDAEPHNDEPERLTTAADFYRTPQGPFQDADESVLMDVIQRPSPEQLNEYGIAQQARERLRNSDTPEKPPQTQTPPAPTAEKQRIPGVSPDPEGDAYRARARRWGLPGPEPIIIHTSTGPHVEIVHPAEEEFPE